MPNWCNNILTITGSRDSLDNCKKAIRNDHNTTWLDFNKIIPNTKSKEESYQEWENLPPHRRTDFESWWFNQIGYDWQKFNWGTKWGAAADKPVESLNKMIYYFETAWSPPKPIIYALSEQHPDLTFNLRFSEPGMGFGGEITVNKEQDICEREDFEVKFFKCPKCEEYIEIEVKNETTDDTKITCQNCDHETTYKKINEEEK